MNSCQIILANITKCFPVGRVWPQKCDRCLQHRPELDCSEPQMSTRTRGPNLPKQAPQSKTRTTSERPEARSRDSDNNSPSSADELSSYGRPTRTTTLERVTKERVTPLTPILGNRPLGATD